MVQCIPVLRPLIKELGNTFSSRKLPSTEDQITAATWQRYGYEAKITSNADPERGRGGVKEPIKLQTFDNGFSESRK
jgi:hypothetical protein